VDTDPQALAASRDNAGRNGIDAQRLSLALPADVDVSGWAGDCDLVMANILAGPLLDLSDALRRFLRPGGTLLLSGLLESQADKVCEHYRDWIALAVAGDREGWVCLRGSLPG
jgi:ribosomal protein L11 methyltransferase